MLITETSLRERASVLQKSVKKSAARILIEQASQTDKTFDIFLSHSKADEETVLGAKDLLEDHGFSVYVDWLEDPHLDRTKVTGATADVLRSRMAQCKMLVYAHSTNSGTSTWMPWELGYFDGLVGKIAILPIVANEATEYKGNEYLGLYPYLDYVPPEGQTKPIFWINRSFFFYADLDRWLRKSLPIVDRTPK
ncbi:MAG: TIR domain-containing protein [Caulobacteraceae bacterium]